MIVRCSSCCVRRVGRVGRAVVEPRVDEEAHVDHVDAVVAGVGERVDRRLEEEEAGVLAGADVDERHVRRDAGDAEAVQRGADRAGDVRAVAVVVLVRPGRRSVGSLARRRRSSGMSVRSSGYSAASKFGAMSGWVPSMPVSMIADEHARVTRLPARTSHRPSRGSSPCPTAGSPSGSAAGAAAAVSAASRTVARSAAVRRSVERRRARAGRCCRSACSARRRQGALAEQVGGERRLDEVAVATPTRRFSLTEKPPAARTARRAEARDVASS